MHKFIGLAIGLIISTLSFAEPVSLSSAVPDSLFELTRMTVDKDEIHVVETLIIATQKQLEEQEQLKELMGQFQKQREAFVQGDQTKKNTARLVKSGREVYALIGDQHLEHLFAKDYLDELHFFSSIAAKKTIH